MLVLVSILALGPVVDGVLAQRGDRKSDQAAESSGDPSLIQQDGDGDYVPDFMDNCPNIQNPNQEDANGDGSGDPCQPPPDSDGDTVPDHADNCPGWANSPQDDSDGDGLGNGCDETPLGDAPPPEETEANFSEPETVEGLDEALAAPAAPVAAEAEPDGEGRRNRDEQPDEANGGRVVEEPAERVIALEEEQQIVEGGAFANGEPIAQEGENAGSSEGEGSGQGGQGRRDGEGEDGGGGDRGANSEGNGDGNGNASATEGGGGRDAGGNASQAGDGEASDGGNTGNRGGPRRNLDFPDTLPAEPPPSPSRSLDGDAEVGGLEFVARIDAGNVPDNPSDGSARGNGRSNGDGSAGGGRDRASSRDRNADASGSGSRNAGELRQGGASRQARARRADPERTPRDERPRGADGDGGSRAPRSTDVAATSGDGGPADALDQVGDDGDVDVEASDAVVRPVDGIAIGADPPPPAEEAAMPRYAVDAVQLGERIAVAQGGDGKNRGEGRNSRWREDEHYRGGTYQRVNGDLNIGGTRDDALYMTQRVGVDRQRPGSFVYEIPVPRDGAYRVRLHFVELIWGTSEERDDAEGQRLFDVSAEGETVLDDYDIYADVGALTAVIKQFDVDVRDGAVTLRFAGERDQPAVSAIEVLAVPPDGETGDGSRREWSGVRPGALLPRRVPPA